MIPTLALAIALFADPTPAAGVRLAPDPVPPAAAATRVPVPGLPAGLPLPAAAGGAAAGLAALAAVRWRGRRPEGDAAPLVVFVSGHGNGSPVGLFSRLVTLMGLDPDRARYYDYRWADGGRNHQLASEYASIDETADALDGYLAGLADQGRPIYLVGFSKGGTSIAELVARWDRQDPGAAHGVIGAALLDPPMASGIHGWLQSVGAAWGPIPDDGGYNPVQCDRQGCVDTRAHLGEASGVEVVVMRNPQAAITNFGDVPKDLRVYEASNGGPGFIETLFTHPWDLASQVTDAHLAVLDDPRIAECIAGEIGGSGYCSLPVPGQHPPAALIGHGPGYALKVPLNKML